MVDLADKRSESEDPATEEQAKKSCADCGTTKTPLWRGGPAGPKSLCNACGIKSRKKRRAILGMNKTGSEEKKKMSKKVTSTRSKAVDLNLMMKRRSKMGQEEKAAVLLMALSYASVYAN